MNLGKALTYDDIQLIPEYSEIKTRSKIDLSCNLTPFIELNIPIIAAPMDTVCEEEMARALYKLGGIGCIHRFMPIEEQCSQVFSLKADSIPVCAAIGVTNDYFDRATELINAGCNALLIDVAHAHHINVKEAITKIKHYKENVDIIVGNIATSEAILSLRDYLISTFKVGIGGGSLCTTRIKTGFGVPNVTALENVRSVTSNYLIADGGIRTSGDIAKALAVGADTVMLGSLLAGTKESPGEIISKNGALYKRYRGSASLEMKSSHKQSCRNIEGESTLIPYKGEVSLVITELMDGLRSALSYAGVDNLKSFHPDYYTVTQAGQMEAKPHLLY